jgi:hypothetical protein
MSFKRRKRIQNQSSTIRVVEMNDTLVHGDEMVLFSVYKNVGVDTPMNDVFV